jgi:cysteine desulfurase
MTHIYLDHNATTRLHPDALEAMTPFLSERYGNPSSIHAAGRAARDAVERAREEVAALVGGSREEVVFTSGGTEGDNLAVRGLAEATRAAEPERVRVIASPLEHPAVRASVAALGRGGFEIVELRVDAAGRIDPDELVRLLQVPTALVTIQLANHELGNVNPVATLAAHARTAGARFHTDAVQAAGKLPIDVAALGVDALTLSAHKLYGPKGAGAVWLRRGLDAAPLIVGGHQERERRPGTENVAALVGFGVAARLARAHGPAWSAHVAALRDRLEAGARAIGGATVNGDPDARVANTSNLAFDDAEGELVVMNLDLAGVCASTGAACTSGSLEPSPVLLALGQSRARAATAVRFSLGRDNTSGEIDTVIALLREIVPRVRAA